ncbi:MAG: methyltransferase domain-containing protein [Anaerolineales bacterium]|nr:methyltransferase domain-containing protein [Anaerolineales bacterium]
MSEAYGCYSQKHASVLEPILRPMASKIVELAKLNGREQVLDLATGTGLIARTIGGKVDSVVGIDISPGMLVRARALSARDYEFVAGDAMRLPLSDQCFDLVTCGLSLSHFLDVSGALREVLRVLHPKGCFIASAWGTDGESPSKVAAAEVRDKFLEDWEFTFGGTLDEEMWANAQKGCEILQHVGFDHVQVDSQFLSGEYRDSTEAIDAALAWPLTRYRVARLSRAKQSEFREETAAAIREVDSLRWSSEMLYYQAIRPED